jgi:hypothetical protein
MSDVKLFLLADGAAASGQSLAVEKVLQSLIEQQPSGVPGRAPSGQRAPTGKAHGGRIDTLGDRREQLPEKSYETS